MIGFANGELIAFGASMRTTGRAVVSLDGEANGHVIFAAADSAQIVAGPDGDTVAAMTVDQPVGARGFEIAAYVPQTGESWVAYRQDPAVLGPRLALRDRQFLGSELPLGWVLLGDSFYPFIVASGDPEKDIASSLYPRLLNLRTGETLQVGPFVDESS